MKSVCQVVQNVYDIDPRVRRKAEALVAAGYSVDVLALRADDGQKNYCLNGVNVRTLALRKQRGSLARYFFEYAAFFLWTFIRVPLQMRRRHYSVIDVNSLPDFLIFAPILARPMGAKLVLDLHEITPEFYVSKYGVRARSWTVRLLTYLENISMRFADRVITINEPIQNLLAGRGLDRSKSIVVMNAVDEARFTASSNSSPALAPRDPEKFVMMYHGTLTNLYGLDIAMEAFAQVHTEMPGAELWILGSGPEKDALEQLAQARGLSMKIRLVGRVPATAIPGWLSQCDVGILPIRRDLFLEFAAPNKLSEFIIMDKPVVISCLKAIRYYFSPDALAYFEPNDPADLARQMVRVYQDRGLRSRLAARAKEEYEPIRWDVMKQRYLRLVEDLAGPGGRTVERALAAEASGSMTFLGDQKHRTLMENRTSLRDPQPTHGNSSTNSDLPHLPTYVLITAARNESKFIEQTINSVIGQSVRPLKWVIVSDGSTDSTDSIVKKYVGQHNWIELVRLPEHAQRNFAGKAAAINAGYARVIGLQYDVIGNLDADVSFEEDYLAFLMSKFADNPNLGVAGTPYFEENGIHDDRFKSPEHVSGACQMFRRQCFEDIGGYPLISSGGIDLIALLSAQAKGWQTRRFDEKVCQHHRNVGSGQHTGIYRRMLNLGKKDYLLGSHPAFEIFRSAFQMKNRPYIVGGVLMLIGYAWSMLRRVERSMPEDLMEIRRHDQMQRLKDVLRHPFGHSARRTSATARS